MRKLSNQYKIVLGRGEPVDFIDLDIINIPAKVDTGAYRSALHARNVILSEDGKTLSFEMLGGHPLYGEQALKITTDKFKEVEVENSFSQREKRYEVYFKVKVAGKKFTAGFTLANRAPKIFPVLLGRKLLNRRFMVDTSHSNVDRLALKRERANIEESH